jgi:P4 family phage/plasmid primase-like protien
MMTDTPRLPPQSREAEQSVLGAVLLDPRALAKAVNVVGVDDFYLTAHQKIYRAMLDWWAANVAIDTITLTERLKVVDELQAVGGAAYLAELLCEVPSAANVSSHAQIVRDHAVRRRLITHSHRMLDAGYGGAPIAQLAHYANGLRVPLVADPEPPAPPRALGTDKGLVKELADAILRTDHFAKDAGGQLYVFEGGAYRPHGQERVLREVKRLLDVNSDTKRWSSHRAREVAEYIGVDAPDLWERPPATVMNLKNGLLDVTTGTLAPHRPDHLSPVQLPVAFDPAATCPQWESFVARVLPDDCRRLPYELVAASMRGAVSDQRAVLLVGAGENGKSTLLDALVAFLGRENVSGLALQRLELDKFATVRLLGKLANVCADLPSEPLAGTSTLKALTGGDRLTAERKFQGSFEFTPFARLLFSTNHYPRSKDSSQAFFRRWLVVPFDAVIAPNERILDLAARLADPHELSGLLNQALAALPAMIRQGGFSPCETTRGAMMEFRDMTDPLAAWVDRFTTLSPDTMVTKKDLLISYNRVAESSARPLMSPKAFYQGVKRLRPGLTEAQRRIHGAVRDVFLGIALKGSPARHASAVSADSAHSFQISLGVPERREERAIELTRGNALNELTEPTGENVVGVSPKVIIDSFLASHGASIPPAGNDTREDVYIDPGAR